jgi:hypothetical protein
MTTLVLTAAVVVVCVAALLLLAALQTLDAWTRIFDGYRSRPDPLAPETVYQCPTCHWLGMAGECHHKPDGLHCANCWEVLDECDLFNDKRDSNAD